MRLTSGNAELDEILGGGFPRNAIHVIMGPPGSGKTVLTEQLCFANAAPERPVLYLVTFSEPLQKLVGFLQRFEFANVDLLGREVVYEYVGEDLLAAPERVAERVAELVTRHRPRIVVIDSFKALADLMPDRSAWRRTLDGIAGLLSAYETTTFLVGEYASEMLTHLPEFAVADGVLELSREERGSRDERYLRVLKLRGSSFLAGRHPLRLGRDGIQAFRRFVTPPTPPEYRPAADRLRSGIAGLDDMIATGFLRGTVTLVAGPSGAGKTSLGIRFLQAGAAEGEPGLLVGFQESPAQLVRAMGALGADAEETRCPWSFDHFYSSPVDLQVDRVAHEIVARIDRQGVRRVVIDAVSDLEQGAADHVRYRDFLYALTQHFAARDVTSMLLVETAGLFTGQGVTGYQVSYMSDNIILLGMELGDELTRTLRVIKSRGSRHDGARRRLRITDSAMEVG